MLADALTERARVLDAGCGRTTRLASSKGRISELVGVDLDAEAGEENDALDRFVAADLCSPLPFEDASFDVVYANFVVEHLAEPDAAFREWRRMLRPGGSLVLLTSNQANPLLAAARLLPWRARLLVKRSGAGVADRDVIPTHYRANTPRGLAALAARTGFVAQEVAYVAGLHRYAVRLRPLALVLLGLERILPVRLRATIVAHYRAS